MAMKDHQFPAEVCPEFGEGLPRSLGYGADTSRRMFQGYGQSVPETYALADLQIELDRIRGWYLPESEEAPPEQAQAEIQNPEPSAIRAPSCHHTTLERVRQQLFLIRETL